MAKINITESELKNIILESVKDVLSERTYGMAWNQMTPQEQEKFTNGLNWYNKRNPEKVYNKRRDTALKNGGFRSKVTQDQYQRMQGNLQNKLNSVYSQLGIDINNPAQYGGEYEQKSQSIIADLQAKAKELETMRQELASTQAMVNKQASTIKNLNNTITQLRQTQQTSVQPTITPTNAQNMAQVQNKIDATANPIAPQNNRA